MKNKKQNTPTASRCACLAATLAYTTLAGAQAPPSVSEKDFLTDMPMVLSVSRLPQRLDDTPGAVTILDRDMIRRTGARDVADLLRLVPGFQTSTSFETGAPLASYHGVLERFSTKLQVLVDGRSVYSPYLFGGTGLGMLTVAMEDIERIEVLRGSNSAAYGARAMLGVVNIVTRHSMDTLGLQAAVRAGENGVRDVQTHIGWGKDAASFRLAVDRRADSGLSGSNGHNELSRVNFRADLQPSVRDEVQLRAGALDLASGKGYPNRADDPLSDRFFGSGYAQLDWRRNLGDDSDLALSLSHSEEIYEDVFQFSLIPLGVRGSIDIDSSGRASKDTVSLQHTFRQGPSLRVVWGGEFLHEQVQSKPIFNTDAPYVSDFTRLFGNAEWRLAKNLILNAGAMAEKSSVNGDSMAPRLMLNWHPAAGQTLRAGFSRAHRPPSTYEQFANVRYAFNGIPLRAVTVARGNIQPESLLSREIGYLGDFPKWGANLDVRVFQESIGGLVRGQVYSLPRGTTLMPSNPRDFVNDEDFVIHGLEYQLKWRPWRDAQLVFNQAYTRSSSRDEATELAAPLMASSLALFQKLPGGLDLSLLYQNSGAYTMPGGGQDNQLALTRTDLRLALPLRFGPNRGELSLVVQNLGSPYKDFVRDFEFQRRAFMTLRIEN